MGKVTLFMHTSLDGFAAGVDGKMDWIHIDDEIFDFGSERIYATEFAIYGRKTFQLMESYWPSAADQPNASKHDIEHSNWYKNVKKVVLSRTLKSEKSSSIIIIGENLVEEIGSIKRKTDKEILIFGSPSAGHSLMSQGLVDNYWFNVNPILLGNGIPVFINSEIRHNLVLTNEKTHSSGVVSLSYAKIDR